MSRPTNFPTTYFFCCQRPLQNQYLFRNKVIKDSQNDIEVLQTGANEYIFTRLKKTEDADDTDFAKNSGSGLYVMYKTPEMNEWIFSPQKVNFDSLDYSNDEAIDQSKIMLFPKAIYLM